MRVCGPRWAWDRERFGRGEHLRRFALSYAWSRSERVSTSLHRGVGEAALGTLGRALLKLLVCRVFFRLAASCDNRRERRSSCPSTTSSERTLGQPSGCRCVDQAASAFGVRSFQFPSETTSTV